MLFRVKAKHYAELGVVLLHLPEEANLLTNPCRLEDLRLMGVAPAVCSTDHVSGSTSNRYARAGSTVVVQFNPATPAELPRVFGAPVTGVLESFHGFISQHLPQDRAMVDPLQRAYGIETLGWTAPYTLAVKVEVKIPYSVKGLRSEEARNERAEDALMLAQHQLSKGWDQLAKEQVTLMQQHLRGLIEVFNWEQVKPLLTRIDLGLWPRKSYAEQVDGARQQHLDAQDELIKAQLRVEQAWKQYSEHYKQSVDRDLREQFAGDDLLQETLINHINPRIPLRYL